MPLDSPCVERISARNWTPSRPHCQELSGRKPVQTQYWRSSERYWTASASQGALQFFHVTGPAVSVKPGQDPPSSAPSPHRSVHDHRDDHPILLQIPACLDRKVLPLARVRNRRSAGTSPDPSSRHSSRTKSAGVDLRLVDEETGRRQHLRFRRRACRHLTLHRFHCPADSQAPPRHWQTPDYSPVVLAETRLFRARTSLSSDSFNSSKIAGEKSRVMIFMGRSSITSSSPR